MRLLHLCFSFLSLVMLVQCSALIKGRDTTGRDVLLADNTTMALSELTPQSLAAQDGVNPLVCVLELSTVQCCETIEPVSYVSKSV